MCGIAGFSLEPGSPVRRTLAAQALLAGIAERGGDAVGYAYRTEGSAIRRSGHERWLRNIAVALGNAPKTDAVIAALQSRREHPSPVVREHVEWALAQHIPVGAA